ncbi:Uncharacterised protein [Vibrio cholerae]|nr:Uncharacterised protein [Vibrio cholerae]
MTQAINIANAMCHAMTAAIPTWNQPNHSNFE